MKGFDPSGDLVCSPMTISTVRHIYWVNQFTNTIGRANLDGPTRTRASSAAPSSPVRGGGRRRPRLLGQQRHRHDRPRQPRRHRRRTRASSAAPSQPARGGGRRRPRLLGQRLRRARSAAPTSTARRRTRASSAAPTCPLRGGGRRRPRLLDQLRQRHDRPRQPRRHGREPELHQRRRRPHRVAVDAGHVYWTNVDARARSAAPTSTAPASNQSFITGASQPVRRRGRRRPRLLGERRRPDTIGRANLDGTGVNQSFITGAGLPSGVAVDPE